MIKWVRAEMGGMAKRKRSAALRFAVNLRETGGRSMNSVHRFWALPKDAGPDLGRLLAGRFHIWDAVAVSECRAEETQILCGCLLAGRLYIFRNQHSVRVRRVDDESDLLRPHQLCHLFRGKPLTTHVQRPFGGNLAFSILCGCADYRCEAVTVQKFRHMTPLRRTGKQ